MTRFKSTLIGSHPNGLAGFSIATIYREDKLGLILRGPFLRQEIEGIYFVFPI